jgi:hypothetical protein
MRNFWVAFKQRKSNSGTAISLLSLFNSSGELSDNSVKFRYETNSDERTLRQPGQKQGFTDLSG